MSVPVEEPPAQPLDLALFEELMRRHNQRLYRVARAILKDDHEAEDALQQAYVLAFTHFHQFGWRSQLSTWLTRIVIREALGCRRRTHARGRMQIQDDGEHVARARAAAPDPEREAYASEVRRLLESSIDALPTGYRLVFVCREVEGLSTAETAEALEVGEEAVKTRLHRARAMIRRDLLARAGAGTAEAFAFHRSRCDAIVARVLAQLVRDATSATTSRAGASNPACTESGRSSSSSS